MREAMLRKQCLTCAHSLAPRYDRMPLMLHQSMLIEWRGRAIDTTMRTKQSMPCAMLYISATQSIALALPRLVPAIPTYQLPIYHSAAIIALAFYSPLLC